MSAVDAKFLDFNYAFEDNVSILPSSEDADFPASNLKQYQRGRVWRSQGAWVIDATNNAIDCIDVTAGAELTALIQQKSYSTTTELAAQIKLAMEGQSVNFYTVDYDEASGVWSITTSGTFLSLLWSTGTNTATSLAGEIGYSTGSDQTGAITYSASVPSIMGTSGEALVFDLKTTEPIDSFAMLFDPSRGVRFSNTATVKLQANPSDEWSAPSVDVTLSVDEDFQKITHFFTADQNYRYWRVSIVDQQNIDLAVELGIVFLSKATALTRCPQVGFSYNVTDQSETQSNQFGNKYSDIYPNRIGFEFDFPLLERADIEAMFEIYSRVGKVIPICFSLDSTEQLWDKDQVFIYGQFEGNLGFKHRVRDVMDLQLAIEEAI